MEFPFKKNPPVKSAKFIRPVKKAVAHPTENRIIADIVSFCFALRTFIDEKKSLGRNGKLKGENEAKED